MDIGEALRTFLLGDGGISALTGGNRIYPVQLPQGLAQPAVRYSIIGAERVHATPTGAIGLARPRIQIDAWAPQYADAYALAELVRKRIDGYRGLMGTVTVQGVFAADERDGFEADSQLYVVSRDYLVWHEEAIA